MLQHMDRSSSSGSSTAVVKREFDADELFDAPSPAASACSAGSKPIFLVIGDRLQWQQQQQQLVHQIQHTSAVQFEQSADDELLCTPVKRVKKLRKGKRLLWQFLLHDLLCGHSDLNWHVDQRANPGVFAFKDPNAAAKRWGLYKENENMSYEKMSRCIRDYYIRSGNRHFGVIQPDPLTAQDSTNSSVKRRRLHFAFNLRHPGVAQYIRQHSSGYYHRLVDLKLIAQ